MLFTVFMKEKAPAAMVAWMGATPLPGTKFIKQNENETSVTTLAFALTQRFHRGLFFRIDRFRVQKRFATRMPAQALIPPSPINSTTLMGLAVRS